MPDPHTWTISYLAARGDAPWRWADDGDVIAWADGTTIIFREELAFILEWLIPQGWPPFGALVWLLAACRGKLPPPIGGGDVPRSATHAQDAAAGQLPLSAFSDRIRGMHSAVEAGLAGLARLPEALRTSPKAKAVLAETVFPGKNTKTGDQALLQAVVAALRSGELTDVMLNHPDNPPHSGYGEFVALHHGLGQVTPESLALRLRTGLDSLPGAATLPVAPAARVRSMLADLRADPEHAGLARLTRDFMAALQLPRLLSEPDEMPLGGFADLSNRGNLDRLLLSELAHDDLTLAVRIALQEALYLRREPPAKQPPSTLAVLLDSGVRLWGVPRLLATAVALALIGKSAQHGKLTAFRASGAGLAQVDLLTREGLTAHLAALETHAHPGAALPAFHRALEDAARHDAVLITQRDVVQDPAFRRSLLAAKFDTLYLAVVDRDGSFELLRTPHTGAPLCRAQVNVNDLLPPPPSPDKPRSDLIDRSVQPDLPVIFSMWPFPLLISVRGKVQAAVETREGAGLCVLPDRRLMQWRDHAQGASTVAANLPRGVTLWLGELADGTLCVVKAHAGRQLACRIFATDGALLRSHDWHLRDSAMRAESHGGLFYVICTGEARVYDLASGAHLGSVAVSRRLSHGRYFFSASEWRILVWDGQAVRLESVPLPSMVLHDSVLRVFNRRGHEGPWFLTRSGQVLESDGTCVLTLGHIYSAPSVSADGERLLVVTMGAGKQELVNLQRLKRETVVGEIPPREWEPVVHPPSLRVRMHFRGIAVSPGKIQLVSRTGTAWDLTLRKNWLELSYGDAQPLAQTVRFESVQAQTATGVSLKVARWPDGRSAWLDNNGMLHLRCADRRRPEVSIALCDGALAVWCSDGLWHGPRFFIGTHEDSPVSELWPRILAFTE